MKKKDNLTEQDHANIAKYHQKRLCCKKKADLLE
jgi:hypothetical protein